MAQANIRNLPLAVCRRIDMLCDQFEQALAVPDGKPIEHFLAGWDGAERLALLNELLELEVETRRRVGVMPDRAHYLRRFSWAPEVVEAVLGPAIDAPAGTLLSLTDFAMESQLGAGGMGYVFRATWKSKQIPVAIKMLKDDLRRRPHLVKRFLREAQSVLRLRHPFLVPMHGLGQSPGGYFLVMDLVTGGSLEHVTRTRTLSYLEIGRTVEQVAEVVQYVHEQGVIHRDLKPSNVLCKPIEPSGASNASGGGPPSLRLPFQPLLTDFGLAKLIGGNHEELTNPGEVLGSLPYMAPEQASPRWGTIGFWTDVYGLGSILYELLTGRPPFKGRSHVDLLAQVESEERPPSPSTLRPGVPADLEAICMTCLSKPIETRYPSADRVVAALKQWRLRAEMRPESGPAISPLQPGGDVDARTVIRPTPGRRAELVGRGGPLNGQAFPVEREPIRLGRHSEANVRIDLPLVSRFHSQVLPHAGGFALEDMGSRNGTKLNGEVISGRAPLADGDLVKVGEQEFTFRVMAGLAPAAPVAALDHQRPAEVVTSCDPRGGRDGLLREHPDAKLRALLDLAQSLGDTLEMERLVPKLLDALLAGLTAAERVTLAQPDANDQWSATGFRQRDACRLDPGWSRSAVRRAAEDRLAILCRDVGSDLRFGQSMAGTPSRSMLAVPLVSPSDKLLGVLLAESSQAVFTADDLQLFASLAVEASRAISQAQRHEAALEAVRLQVERQVVRRIQQRWSPPGSHRFGAMGVYGFRMPAGLAGRDYVHFALLPDGGRVLLLVETSGREPHDAWQADEAVLRFDRALRDHPPIAALEQVCRELHQPSRADQVLPAMMVVVDEARQLLLVVNAGHSPALRWSRSGPPEPLAPKQVGPPLGSTDSVTYNAIPLPLGVGDAVVIWNDALCQVEAQRHQRDTAAAWPDPTIELSALPTALAETVCGKGSWDPARENATVVVIGRRR